MKKNSKPEATVVKRCALAFGLVVAVVGCAGPGGHPKDPLEPMNRATFQFNEKADKYVLRPVAQAYDLAPLPVKTGVANFFGNIADVWIGVNNLLQGKFADGFSDGGRFLLNSTVGLLGVFDVASEIGLEKHDEDLGQTLGWWGVGDGPYLVLPLLGPSNVRDGVSLIGDFRVDPLMQFEDVGARNSLSGLRLVSKRAALLGADTAAEEAALDKYGYMRSFYMQYRRNQIFDGQPPREKDLDDDDSDNNEKTAPDADAAGSAVDRSSSPDKKDSSE